METKVYAVRDAAVDAYLAPFFVPADGLALRGFSDAVGDPKSNLSKHPEDFSLWCLGAFDDNSGVLVGLVPARRVASALDFIPRSKE